VENIEQTLLFMISLLHIEAFSEVSAISNLSTDRKSAATLFIVL